MNVEHRFRMAQVLSGEIMENIFNTDCTYLINKYGNCTFMIKDYINTNCLVIISHYNLTNIICNNCYRKQN